MMDLSAPLSIVVPVYNEGPNIARLFHEIADKIRTPHEILVVYDFDEDDTLPVIRRDFHDRQQIRLVKNPQRGVVHAIKTGLRQAQGKAAVVVMADLCDSLEVVDRMVELNASGYDVVCGSRYMRGGRQIGGPRLKGLLSRAAGLTLHHLGRLPTHDATNSFKLYGRRVIDTIPIESDGGFEIGMELTVKAHLAGLRITEVPSTWTDRTAGQSKFKLLKWLPHYLRWYALLLREGWKRRKTA
jgi:dolichol-phosphate mannosyltransferase